MKKTPRQRTTMYFRPTTRAQIRKAWGMDVNMVDHIVYVRVKQDGSFRELWSGTKIYPAHELITYLRTGNKVRVFGEFIDENTNFKEPVKGSCTELIGYQIPRIT